MWSGKMRVTGFQQVEICRLQGNEAKEEVENLEGVHGG